MQHESTDLHIQYISLLGAMRDFYCLQRDPAIRFPRYMALVNPVEGRIRAALTLMNPLAKENLCDVLDNILACGVDNDAPHWVVEMAQRLGMNSGYCMALLWWIKWLGRDRTRRYRDG